jgi:SAM-dependent methyltransferase
MDYLSSIPYTRRAWPIMAPSRIDYVAARAGIPIPERDAGQSWCEIGCGYGLTATLLAASNPDDLFVAIDLMPEHIRSAQAIASAAGLTNLRLIAGDVCAIPDDELPGFDFIVLHGVYSWVPERVRTAIIQLIGRKLKPGGRVLISYNAQPGWKRIHPIRDLLLELASQHPGAPIERVRHSVLALKPALSVRHPNLADDPFVTDWVARLLEKDPHYVAHEYFGDCASFRFSEINALMRHAGLRYAGDAFLPRNDPELSFEPGKLDAARDARAIPDVEQRESMLDDLAQTTFRIDIFARPGGRPAESEQGFALLVAPHEAKRNLALPGRELQAHAPEHDAILSALANGPATADQIAKSKGIPRHRIDRAIHDFVVMSQVAPCPAKASDDGQASRYNRVVLRQVRPHPEPVNLACAKAGTWLEVTSSDMVYLAALNRLADSGVGLATGNARQIESATLASAATLMEERGWFLRNPDGSKMTDRNAVARVLTDVFGDTVRRIPFYKSMGIARP